MRKYDSQRNNRGNPESNRRFEQAHRAAMRAGLNFFQIIGKTENGLPVIETDIDRVEYLVKCAIEEADHEQPDDCRQPSASFTARNATAEARLLAEIETEDHETIDGVYQIDWASQERWEAATRAANF